MTSAGYLPDLSQGEPAAALAALNAELLRHDSATLALERWCRAHGMTSCARVIAQLVHCSAVEPTAAQRCRLDVDLAELVRYRRVRLSLAGRVLSEADNWYVPGRLTLEMNRRLDCTDIPFGRVVRDLRFRRRLLAADVLWKPSLGGARAAVPPRVLRHHALLVSADGVPISEVVETYMCGALFLAGP